MPQKKTAKRAKMKSAAKRQTQNGMLALAEKVEKEFRQIPTKLAKLYRQELMAQNRQASKLKSEIKTAQSLQKMAQQKCADLMKATPSKSSKKQLMKATDANKQAEKNIKMLSAKLNQIAQSNDMLLIKQNKYQDLNKELARLEKQLTLKALESLKAKKTAVKPGKAKKAKQANPTQQPQTKEVMTEEAPFMISSNPETAEVEL